MPISKFRPTFTFTQDRLEQLKAIAPEAFADGKINWESLKQALGEFLEDENQEAEHFGLFWPGKREARRLATMPSKGTLVPVASEGINENLTGNIFIEGENLEVLKLLQKSYAGRIKMIYIDPPYNTGNDDFIYNDDYKERLDDYLRKTGQADENGISLTTNTKASGRYHSNWLNMMYSRLVLARQLLRDDGVIFISIDDNEVMNLRTIMDEIFGSENFIAQLTTVINLKGNQDQFGFAGTHEYAIVYARDKSRKNCLNEFTLVDEELEEYDQIDDIGPYKEGATLMRTGEAGAREKRPKGYFPIYVSSDFQRISISKISQNDYEIFPKNLEGKEMSWRWSPDTVAKDISEIIAKKTPNGIALYKKQRLSLEDGLRGKKPKTTFYKPQYSSGNGIERIKNLFDAKVYDNPKTVELLRDFVELGSNKNSIILDFFSGSGTIAEAVLNLNHFDGGNRRFILVQWPEPTPSESEAHRNGFKIISEIGKERIRRVIAKMKKEAKENSQANSARNKTQASGAEDLGFKVFKLTRSNFRAWEDYEGENPEELEKLFDQAETPLVENWKEQDLLTEIILQQGFPLDSRITQQVEFKQNTIQLIESTFCAHRLFVCLDAKIKDDTIKRLELRSDDIFVCLDSALTDQAKMRLADVCRLNII